MGVGSGVLGGAVVGGVDGPGPGLLGSGFGLSVVGFGLGFSVMLDPAKAQILGTPGEYAWGGAASTAFWCDPGEDMAVVLLTQLTPSSTYPIRRELRVLTYQAIVE